MEHSQNSSVAPMKRWGLVLTFLVACGGESPTPVPTGLSVAGEPPDTVGRTSQLTATLRLSDGTTQDVTQQASWASSAPGIATVSAGGIVTAVSGGSVEISATFEGLRGATELLIPERLFIVFSDPENDHTGGIDAANLIFDFDKTTGDYEIELTAFDAAPFRGAFRVNINILNADLGTRAQDPAFFQDTFNDFDLTESTTSLALSGTSTRLMRWSAGHRVAPDSLAFGSPDGGGFFRTSVSDLPLGGFREREDIITFGSSTTVQRR